MQQRRKFGTLDGANAEIVEQAGEENNYIFGAKVYEISQIYDSYNSLQIYNQNPRIKRALDTLVNGTFQLITIPVVLENFYNSILWRRLAQTGSLFSSA